MTATPAVSCPDWCVDCGNGCRGEHFGEKVYLPATGNSPVTDNTGTMFPAVGVGAYHNALDGGPISVDLHIVGPRPEHDVDVSLRVLEARALVDRIEEVLSQLGNER